MDTMNIALPEPLKAFVQDQVAGGSYSSVSEYVRELIRADQQAKARLALEQEVLRGLQSGDGLALTKSDWNAIREEVARRSVERSEG